MDNKQKNKIVKFIQKNKVITTSELLKFLQISWNTAQSYLMDLALERRILRIKKLKVNLWMLNKK